MQSSIKVGLASYGMSGKVFHAPFLAASNQYELVACWERSKKLINNDYLNVISCKSYEELLAIEDIDLIIVNTPNITHYEYAKKALLAGKHVIVEKPFTVTSKQGRELADLAKHLNKQLSVFQNRRYDSDFLTVKKVLDEKLLGDIVEAEIHFDRFVEGLSYKVHKETPVLGVGLLYDLGSHIIDQALMLFGKPSAVFADIRIVRPISKVDDYFEVLLYYPNIRVRLRSTYVAREQVAGYIIHGTKGSFIKPKSNIQEEALVAGIPIDSSTWGEEQTTQFGILHTSLNDSIVRAFYPSVKGNYADYFSEVAMAILNKSSLPVTAEEAIDVITIIEAAYLSNSSKQIINL